MGEDHYENVAICVDDVLIASKDPKSATDVLTNNILLNSKEWLLFFIILAVTLVVMLMVLCMFHPKSVSRQLLIATTACLAPKPSSPSHYL